MPLSWLLLSPISLQTFPGSRDQCLLFCWLFTNFNWSPILLSSNLDELENRPRPWRELRGPVPPPCRGASIAIQVFLIPFVNFGLQAVNLILNCWSSTTSSNPQKKSFWPASDTFWEFELRSMHLSSTLSTSIFLVPRIKIISYHRCSPILMQSYPSCWTGVLFLNILAYTSVCSFPSDCMFSLNVPSLFPFG